MFPAARSTDPFVCDKHPVPPSPKGGGTIAPRASHRLVRIGMMPAAREGDEVLCAAGGKETILDGEPSVRIEGKKAARMNDPIGTKTGGMPIGTGKIVLGCPTVRIGGVAQAVPLRRAAENGTPFCEDCEKMRNASQGGAT